ncbi:MAG: 30S ribosomal protein S20 [Bacteroidota bacterium]|nr:30S ribosomal protein S20 [Bacteroidota bacterium]
MANHPSAKKRIRTNARKKLVNKTSDSKVKTYVKKALGATEVAEAEKLYKEAVAILDKSAAKGKIHKNTAARKKSALTKYVNGLTAVPAK